MLRGIEMQQKPAGEDNKVTSMSLERETANELPDSLGKGLVEEFGCYPKTPCQWQETGEGKISSVAVGQGWQHCEQLYLPGENAREMHLENLPGFFWEKCG